MLAELQSVSFYDLSWGEEIDLPSTRNLKETPHLIGGRYPCRSAPYIPHLILRGYSDRTNSTDFGVLDPFMGSGTTAIEANKFTSQIFGLEIDPYARLVASVSSLKYSNRDRQVIREISEDIVENVATVMVDQSLEPSLKNIDYWFDSEQYDDLLRLKSAIFSKTIRRPKVRNFLLTAFGDIVRGCSKAERQSLKPYISKRFTKKPAPVLPTFEKAVHRYLLGVAGSQSNLSAGIKWGSGTATEFSLPASIDVAITSPPYINAMDYTRCIKLESAWIGTADDSSIADVRAGQLGEAVRAKQVTVSETVEAIARPHINEIASLDRPRYMTCLTYFQDMFANLEQVYHALEKNGEYHVIIGNSRIRGVDVATHEVLAELGQAVGFDWQQYIKYPIKDHRTSIPRNGQGGKIEYEHVLTLVK